MSNVEILLDYVETTDVKDEIANKAGKQVGIMKTYSTNLPLDTDYETVLEVVKDIMERWGLLKAGVWKPGVKGLSLSASGKEMVWNFTVTTLVGTEPEVITDEMETEKL